MKGTLFAVLGLLAIGCDTGSAHTGVTEEAVSVSSNTASDNNPPSVPPGFVWTHNGYFHPSCIVEIKPGETIVGADKIIGADGKERAVPPCNYPHYDGLGNVLAGPLNASNTHSDVEHSFDGWVVDFGYVFSGAVTWLSNEYAVPPAPHNYDGQDDALFEGLEVAGSVDEIIQPVLDWNGQWQVRGENCCQGTPPNQRDYVTSYVAVNQGDTLDTYMYPESVTHCPAGWGQWQIGINVNGYNVIGFSTCTWQNGYNWAFGNVLEVHGGNGCADLPQADYGVSTSGLYVLVNGFSGNQAPSTWQPDIYSTWPFCSQNASGSGANGSMWWIDHN